MMFLLRLEIKQQLIEKSTCTVLECYNPNDLENSQRKQLLYALKNMYFSKR